MSHQFKPGDLVMITAPENFGRCAEVSGVYMGPCRAEFRFGGWQEIPEGVVAFSVKAENLTAVKERSDKLVLVDELAYKGKWLKPLRGDFAPEQQKAKEVEPCA
ncbi:hypothetical protein [Pseudomonas syringae group genomosp. 3]|uniref:hypothetical protein n=1 Tax=Pseudomonas syringae group genomosp. 3 TaxID=251701 RepID=UPI000709551D|nr:hypothetical protein [Pseudomonas syringae group genomosp. 3]